LICRLCITKYKNMKTVLQPGIVVVLSWILVQCIAAQPKDISLINGIVLKSETYTDTKENPTAKIEVTSPVLEGDGEPVVIFNRLAGSFTRVKLAEFSPAQGVENSFHRTYRLLSNDQRYVSVRFDTTESTGTVHPEHFSTSFNFDLKTGKEIKLASLFKPGSVYLKLISDHCLKALHLTEDDPFQKGALPDAKNFETWNITPGGLLITFQEYQVGAYVDGRPEVTIPYTELKSVIDLNGPLGRYVK